MSPKAKIKMAVDILMTVLLLFLMGYQFWSEEAHEWAGAGMFLAFIIHHGLNWSWHKNLFRGRYSPSRIFMLIIDILVFASMIGLMVSGIILSNHVFAFLPIKGGTSFARLLHMAASHWGFVLMALHIGLHWGMMASMMKKAFPIQKPSKVRKIVLRVIGTCIALYGLTVFIGRDFPIYMFLQSEFVFMDYDESRVLFYLDYLAMMGTFIYLAYYGSALLKRLSGKK